MAAIAVLPLQVRLRKACTNTHIEQTKGRAQRKHSLRKACTNTHIERMKGKGSLLIPVLHY